MRVVVFIQAEMFMNELSNVLFYSRYVTPRLLTSLDALSHIIWCYPDSWGDRQPKEARGVHICCLYICVHVWIPWSAAPPSTQVHNCWSYQLGPLISVISLAEGNKGLIWADGLQPTRPLGPFTFCDNFVSLLIGHINHFGPSAPFDCLLLH